MKLFELYQEKRSTITHDGKKYDLNTLFKLTEDSPVVDVDVDDLLWVLEHDTPDNDRVKKADVTKPILVHKMKDDKLVPIDGLHRLEKARRGKLKMLPAKMVTNKMLDEAEI